MEVGRDAQVPQHLSRILADGKDLQHVAPVARRHAFDEELQAPAPLLEVQARAEQQRRVSPPQPLENLERRLRVGPGLDMRDRDLATIGERSLQRRRAVPLDDGDVVSLLAKEPRGRGPDHARAEDQNLHLAKTYAYSATGTQAQNRLRSP